jgi:hypothetical protein
MFLKNIQKYYRVLKYSIVSIIIKSFFYTRGLNRLYIYLTKKRPKIGLLNFINEVRYYLEI